MHRLEADSIISGRLPNGCRFCRDGRKMVLFVTPLCKMKCFYCPVSDERKNGDVFANERAVFSDDDILDEVVLSRARGTGVTGGDPLALPLRTVHYIKLLKKNFGNRHHIHLYTITPNIKLLEKLFEAGLDEARVHVPHYLWNKLEKSIYYSLLKMLNAEGYTTGVEIPVLPGRDRDLTLLIKSLEAISVPFINLNELEFSPTNWIKMEHHKIALKSLDSAQADGSMETAYRVIKEHGSEGISIHFCSSIFKDSVQLRNRLILRAKSIKKPYEIVTEDGTLVRGLIEGNIDEILTSIKTFMIEKKYYFAVKEKNEVEIAPWILKTIYRKIPGRSFIVETYPTADKLEVERMPLTP